MIKKFLYALCVTVIFTSCHKSLPVLSPSNITDDNGCVSRVWLNPTDYSISAQDDSAAISLFAKNGIGYSNLRFFQVIRDTVGNIPYLDVRANLYLNGLPVFSNDVSYSFKNGNLDFKSSYNLATSLDTLPVLRITQVRKLFIDKVDSPGYKDSCVSAEFGYYDLNTGKSTQANVAKAWKVHPAHSEYPIGIFSDNGQLLYYFNGIIIL